MPSKARESFVRNSADIDRLLAIHGDLRGAGRNMRRGVVSKVSVLLVTAFWEAFCEDLAAEALEHMVTYTRAASNLPMELRRTVAKELESDVHDLAVWQLADAGWRDVVIARLPELQRQRNWNLNTPRSANVDKLFLDALGVRQLSTSWSWQHMTSTQAASKLDDYVTLRGEIAHRGETSVGRSEVEDYFQHASRLVEKTEARVNAEILASTGRSLF